MKLLDNMKTAGFILTGHENGLLVYRLRLEKEVEVAFYGTMTQDLEIQVSINQPSEFAIVSYSYGGRNPFKVKTYSSLGLRTWNAIKETARCKGFDL